MLGSLTIVKREQRRRTSASNIHIGRIRACHAARIRRYFVSAMAADCSVTLEVSYHDLNIGLT
jgi:hypothetical protein